MKDKLITLYKRIFIYDWDWWSKLKEWTVRNTICRFKGHALNHNGYEAMFYSAPNSNIIEGYEAKPCGRCNYKDIIQNFRRYI